MDSQLHEVWYKETGKQRLWKLIQQFQVNYTRFRMLDIVAVHNFDQIISEHVELFEVIHQKDRSSVTPLVQKHLYGGINRLGGRIQTEFGGFFQK
jgi:DNA-binding GntR family transcriptional regulator